MSPTTELVSLCFRKEDNQGFGGQGHLQQLVAEEIVRTYKTPAIGT
jgi:hypothetical protein